MIKPLNLKKKNRKGQIESIFLAVIILVVIGIIIFFFNHVDKKLYDSLDEHFQGDPTLNDTEAHQALQDIQSFEGSNIWDWVFLAIFIGINIQMIVFSFASKQNVAFFWLFVIIGLVVLLLGTVLSNIWQEIANNPEFSTTLVRFPITNSLLGAYYPIVITGLFYLSLIILFGKFPGQQEQ